MSRLFKSNALKLGFAVFLWSLAVPTSGLVGQQVEVREECYCTIDAAGNRDCSCSTSEGSRARIGVGFNPDQSAEEDALGVVVSMVAENSPAEAAGLREGDVITAVQGLSLLLALDGDMENGFDSDRSIPVQRLQALSGSLEPGDEVEVSYERDGQSHISTLVAEAAPSRAVRLELEGLPDRIAERMRGFGEDREHGVIELHIGEEDEINQDRGEGRRQIRILRRGGESDSSSRLSDDEVHVWRGIEGIGERGNEREIVLEEFGRGGARGIFIGEGSPEFDGLELVKLQPGVADYFRTDGGVLVANVDESSVLGLQPGDVILRIGEREADSPDRVRRILRSYDPEEGITFHIMRNHEELSVEGQRNH